jgi:hypothetical protein
MLGKHVKLVAARAEGMGPPYGPAIGLLTLLVSFPAFELERDCPGSRWPFAHISAEGLSAWRRIIKAARALGRRVGGAEI